MEFKGTKGEWSVNKGNNVVSKHNLPIAIVFDGYTPHGSFKNEDEKDREANAKIIAAAPEMFEMLKETFNLCDKMQFPTEQELKELKIKAKELLTKITKL